MRKRVVSLFLALALVVSLVPLGAGAVTVKRGDVDRSGGVDYLDAMQTLRCAVKLTEFTPEQIAIGDMDNSGTIDYLDAMMILRVAVKLMPEEEMELPESGDGPQTVLGKLTDRKISNEADARALILETAELTGITGGEETLGDCQSYNALGSVFYRFQQMHGQLPVYGRTVTVGASDGGDHESLTHNYLLIEAAETEPGVSGETAAATALREFPANAQVREARLVIWSFDVPAPVPAWQIRVTGPELDETCFVDAVTCEYITGFSNLLYDTQRGSYGDAEGNLSFNTEKNADGSYSLVDRERNIFVYDAGGQTVTRTVADDAGVVYLWEDNDAPIWGDGKGSYVAPDGSPVTVDGDYPEHGTWQIKKADGTVVGKNADFHSCVGEPLQVLEVLSNDSTDWTNGPAAKAMAYTAGTYDFYREVLGRIGFNGTGGDMRVLVNDGMNGNSANAFAVMGSTGAFAFLNFGSDMTLAPDVVGHEYNHAVEDSISDMIYAGESGSIMEGMADIFGELAEDWMNDGQMDNDCSWTNGARNMRDPSASSQKTCYYEYNGQHCPVKAKNSDGMHLSGSQVSEPGLILPGVCTVEIKYPAKYMGANYCCSDNSSLVVHTNCTVISRAAYLMAHGINGDNMKMIPTGLLAKMWFRAMCMMSADCDFYECRKLVELAASTLNLTTQQLACVAEAFQTVGIQTEEEEEQEISFHLQENAELSVYGGDGELYDDYTLSLARFDSLQAIRQLAGAVSYDKTLKVEKGEPVILNVEPGVYLMRLADNGNTDLVYQRILLISPLGEASGDFYTCFGGTAVRGTVSSVETVNGRKRNVPLADARVFAYEKETGKLCGVAWLGDTNGVFTMYLAGGEYSLIARAEGYEPLRIDLTVRDGEKVYQAMVLGKEQSAQVDRLLSTQEGGEEKERYSMHYNENGQLSRVYWFGTESAVVSEFEYDSQGRLVYAERHGSTTTKKQYTYNGDGLLAVYQEFTGSRTVPELQVEYTYGDYGLCEMENHYVRSRNDLVLSETVTYRYVKDVDGRVLERHKFVGEDPDYVTVDRCEYDEKGRISLWRSTTVSREQYRSNGNDHIEDAMWVVREYIYDYAPFVLIRDEKLHLTLELRDSADVAVWSVRWENTEPEAAGSLLIGLDRTAEDYTGEIRYLEDLTPAQEQRRLLRDELIWASKQHPIKTQHKYYAYYTFYTVYDIDGDGMEELIVNEDSGDYSVYTYNGDQAVLCGEAYWNYGDEMYHYPGNGMVVHDGGQGILGLEYMYLYTLEKGKLKQKEVLATTEQITRKELYAELAKYEKIPETIRLTDLKLLDGLVE